MKHVSEKKVDLNSIKSYPSLAGRSLW